MHDESPRAEDEYKRRLKALERENLERRRANEILSKASAFFAQAALDRPLKRECRLSTNTVVLTGSSQWANTWLHCPIDVLRTHSP